MSSTKSPARRAVIYDGARYVMAESTGHQLFLLMQAMRREVEARMAQHGLTDAQWKPMWHLKRTGGSTAQELSREMCADAGAMTRLLDRLEEKGFIERLRSSTDRRVVNLRLTPAGAAVAEHIPRVLASVNNDFLRGFSRAEWQQLGTLLQRMLANGQALAASQEAA